MSFIKRSSSYRTPARKTATFDFTPTVMAIHAKLFPSDWSKGNPDRKRTEHFCNLLGLNGHLFPNDVATAFLMKNNNGSPFIRISSNIVDVCGNLVKLIPAFTPNYYEMFARIIESRGPPVLTAYALWFITYLSFRLNLLSAEHMALFHATLFDLAGNGTISADFINYLRSQGCSLPESCDTDFYTTIHGLPFPTDFYGTLQRCASFRRAKDLPFEITKTYVDELLQTRGAIVLTDDDWNYIDRCYNRLELNRHGEALVEVPSVEAATSNHQQPSNHAACPNSAAKKQRGTTVTKKSTAKATTKPPVDDAPVNAAPTSEDEEIQATPQTAANNDANNTELVQKTRAGPPKMQLRPRAAKQQCVDNVAKSQGRTAIKAPNKRTADDAIVNAAPTSEDEETHATPPKAANNDANNTELVQKTRAGPPKMQLRPRAAKQQCVDNVAKSQGRTAIKAPNKRTADDAIVNAAPTSEDEETHATPPKAANNDANKTDPNKSRPVRASTRTRNPPSTLSP